MATIRQMPAVYLRGSIASVTMAGLSSDEKAKLDRLVKVVGDHPEMARNKARMIRELGNTIRGDYADDKRNAEQEYEIAICRGLVDLFYHRHYTYECGECKSSTYLTKRGKPKAIERPYVPCPACGAAVVKDRGFTDLIEGQVVDHAEQQKAHEHMLSGGPRFGSVIKPIPGERKHENPQAVIDCPKQLKKFFGEFVWNYFRQHIKENKRKVHKKVSTISGTADTMGVELIRNVCERMKIMHHYDGVIQEGRHRIFLSTLQTPPEFTIEMASIQQQMSKHQVEMSFSNSSVDILVNPASPVIQVNVIKPEHVMMVENQAISGEDDESSGFSISQVSHKTIAGGAKMDQDDHVGNLDRVEAGKRVRDSLPDGDCKKIYDILSQNGESYDEFAKDYGHGLPKNNHIAEFLKISTRTVKQHKESIKIYCYAFDFGLDD